MKKLIDLWANFVVGKRIWVIIAMAMVIGAFFVPMKNLYFEGSTDMWFLEGDPVLKLYQNLKETFQNDEYLVIGVKSPESDPDIFTEKTLSLIKKMTDFLEEHEAVTKVRSITKFQYIQSRDETLDVTDLIPMEIDDISELPPDQIREMAAIVSKETIIHGLMITKDMKHTMISARVVEELEGFNPKIKLALDFKEFVREQGLDQKGVDFFIGGSAAITESYFTSSNIDQSIIYPLMIGTIIILLAIIFRSLAGVLLPLMVVINSVIMTFGFTGMMGWPINMLNVALPTLLTAIGLCDTLHILTGFYKERYSGSDPKTAAIESIKKYFMPCLYTTITTAIGFIALASGKLNPVLEFGIEAAFGVAAAFLLSVTILPAILSFVHGREKNIERFMASGFSARIIDRLSAFTMANSKIILVATAGVIGLSFYFITQIEVDTNFVRNFKKDYPIRKNLEYFNETYKGALSLEFFIDSGEPGGVKNPEFLERTLKFQNYLESREHTGRASSMLDYLLKINQVLHNDDPAHHTLPGTREHVAQYLFLYSSSGPEEDLSDMKNHEERMMRITVLCKVASSSVTKAWVKEIQKKIDTEFKDLDIRITGRMVLFNNMDIYVQEGLTRSFSLALVLIVICFFVIFRSFKYGLLSLIPSVLPIIVAGGVMGILNIYLDFGSMVVAAVTMGLAVDDTIHFMSQYIHARREGKTRKEAVHFALSNAGRAILFTSVILCCGFSMMLLSTFVPNMYVGILGGTVILLALLGDLLILPGLILFSNKE